MGTRSQIITALIVATFFLSPYTAKAETETGAHGTIAATSNYVWRGISQTDNRRDD